MSNNEINNPFSIFNINIDEMLNRTSLINMGAGNLLFDSESFNLLQSIKDNNSISLKNLLYNEKSHIQLFPQKYNNNEIDYLPQGDDSNNEQKNKNNFFKDSFFNQILSSDKSKEAFENINSNKQFEAEFNSDMNNSTKFFLYNILNKINEKTMKDIVEKLNNQIKSLTQFQKENLSLISNVYQVPKEIKEIKYYQKVKPNGDSFYISFIYQFVRNLIHVGDSSIISRIINLDREYNILNPVLEESIQQLGNEYLNKTESYHMQDLKNLGQAFTYLGIIYNLMAAEKNDVDNAVKMFDLAFFYDKFFWKLLCLFMKSHIKKFLRKNQELFTKEEFCEKNKLIPQKYFLLKDKKFDYELYVNDNILINQMEPSLFIISIVPYTFNVSLNLFINEEGTQNLEDNNKLFKLELNPNGNMDINILYSSYSYHIIECKNDENLDMNIKINFDICSVFNNTKGNESKISQYKKDYIDIFVNREKCKECSNKEYVKIKSLNNNYPQCLKCFKNIIDDVLIQRYNYMVKEKFRYIEYYLKEIPLLYIESSNDYINLSQTEFFYLFNKSLFTYFRELIDNVCDSCGKHFKVGKIIHKICGCKRCIECAIKECKIILFNDFEKKFIYKDKKINCQCGKDLELINYCSQIFSLLNNKERSDHEKEAKNRIKNYIQNYCMVCGKELEKNKISINKKIHFSYNFMVSDLNKNKKKKEHNLCEYCNDKKMKNKNSNEKIFCVICNEYHEFNNGFNNKSIQIQNPLQDPNIDKVIDKFKKNSGEKSSKNDPNNTQNNNDQNNNINNNEGKNSEKKDEVKEKENNEDKTDESKDQKNEENKNNDNVDNEGNKPVKGQKGVKKPGGKEERIVCKNLCIIY